MASSMERDMVLLVSSARVDPVLREAVHRVDRAVRDMRQALIEIVDNRDGSALIPATVAAHVLALIDEREEADRG